MDGSASKPEKEESFQSINSTDSELAKLESDTSSYENIQQVDEPAQPESNQREPVKEHEPYVSAAVLRAQGVDPNALPGAKKSRRFLIAYVTSIFSALAILSGVAILGYAVFDHFLGAKDDEASLFYFDLAPVYLSIMASLAVFGLLYIVASRYVTKSASNDTIGLKDWRAYKVVYAFFAALLLVSAASVIASLIYIPLAQAMIADDLESKQVVVQVLASLHVLVWIAVLIWQERLVKKGKQSWLQGGVVIAGVIAIVVVTGIFPIGGKYNERYDHRIEEDLSTIESKISEFKLDSKGALPMNLNDLKFSNDATIKNRLSKYEFTAKEAPKPTVSASESIKKLQQLAMTGAMSNEDESAYSEAALNAYAEQTSTTTKDDSTDSTQSEEETASKPYEICATFKTDTTQKVEKDRYSALSAALTGDSASTAAQGSDPFTRHKAGRVCFTRE